MKTSRTFALISLSLAIGFLAARWCAAQSAQQSSNQKPKADDFGALQQLESFVTHLRNNGQTENLLRFSDYLNASLASRDSADLGMTVAVLQRFRDGRTNEACRILEDRLDTYIVGLAGSYRQLPPQLQAQGNLKVLGFARDYRAKFPFKCSNPELDKNVTDAFKLLDEKAK
jgi:hypothetical protein